MSTATLEAPVVSDVVGVSTTLGELLAAVKAASSAVNAKPAMPILSHVEVTAADDTVTVSGIHEGRNGDMEAMATATAPAIATVAPGCVLLPAKPLLDMLTAAGKRAPKKVSDAWLVSIAAMDGKAVVDVNGSAFNLTAQDAAEFPTLPSTDGADAFTLDTATLIRIMDAAAVAASKGDTLPILAAIRMEAAHGILTLLSTDRFRLTMSETFVDMAGEHDALVPVKWWTKTKRHLNKKAETVVRFHGDDVVTGGYVSFHNAGNVFTAANVDGDYPKIRSLFPDSAPISYSVDADALLAAAASVAPACERNTPIRLRYDGDGTLTLDGGTGEDMQASATVAYGTDNVKDEPFTVAFNPHYLLEGLKLFKGQRITWSHTTAPKPAVLSADDTLRYLLMPVRLPGA